MSIGRKHRSISVKVRPQLESIHLTLTILESHDDVVLDIDGNPQIQVILNADTKMKVEFNMMAEQIMKNHDHKDPFEDREFFGSTAISLEGNAASYEVDCWKRLREI